MSPKPFIKNEVNIMVFSSYAYIFMFMPVLFIGYFSLAKIKNGGVLQKFFLLAASLFFYGFANPLYLLLLAASVLVNYGCAVMMSKQKARLWLVLGIVFNVLFLGYFKYFNFFVDNLNAIFSTDILMRQLILPLGISFFTFQQILFLTQVYKKQTNVGKFLDYCLFVSFFPCITMGPITEYDKLVPQFSDESKRHLDFENFTKGLYIFVIGLFKKIVISDTVAIFANNGYAVENPGLAVSWITALSYTLQIYFDFSGYSDMALGIAKMLNIDIPVNFDSPYKSKSITEFWKRWHMTLGNVLTKCVYIPLGGNREGKFKTYRNLMLTFLVSGIWHGAAWTFIAWGALQGIFSILERVFKNTLEKIPNWIRIFTTFILVNFFWVLFRAESFEAAMAIYKGMFSFTNIGLSSAASLCADGIVGFPTPIALAYIFGLLALLYFVVFRCKNTLQKAERFEPNTKNLLFIVILFTLSVVHLSRLSVFIYTNF